MEALEAIHRRRSVKFFASEPVPLDALEQLLEAAYNAPSGANYQHCQFVVVTEREVLDSLGETRFQGVPGRMERVDAGQDFKVVVDFAHTAGALGAALEALRPYCAGKLTVVFGCPGERDRTKRSVMGEVAARLADFVILTSDEPRSEDPLEIVKEIEAGVKLAGRTEGRDYVSLPDRREALAEALGRARCGDVVLLAGKGHEDCIIYGDRTVPWSDSLVALDLLKDRRSI